MNKLTSLVIACALAAGCKGKHAGEGAPPPQTGSGSASGASLAADPAWADKLPSVAGGDTQLLMQFASGLVRIGADGSIAVASPPTTAPADPRTPGPDPFAGGKVVQLGELGDALGLPPVKPRPDSAYGVVEETGSAGSASAPGGEGNPADVAFAGLGHPAAAVGAPVPARRMTTAFALSHPNDVSGGVMVFADANASATVLVDVLSQTGGFLAVRDAGKLGALPLQLDRSAPAPASPVRTWVEVRLGNAIELETVPGTPAVVPSLDKLGEAVKASGATAVDLLVTQQTKVQDVVAAIEQLRAASVEAIGVGAVPGPDGGVRGTQGPRVLAWDVYVPDADKPTTDQYRAALAPVFEPMRACYEAELAKAKGKPLTGSGQIEVFLTAAGTVQGAKPPAGMPVPLAKCATEAFKTPVTLPPGAAAGRLTAKVAFLPR